MDQSLPEGELFGWCEVITVEAAQLVVQEEEDDEGWADGEL